jgi:hypothetical protein
MASLLRKMPYEQLAGANIGDDELFAGTPNWVDAETIGRSPDTEAAG